MSDSEITVREAYEVALRTLNDCDWLDTDEARAIARQLVDLFAEQPHAHLLIPDANLHSGREPFLMGLEEVASGRPLAYFLGEREFYGLSFLCDERALIPRPETELLVEEALRRLKERPSALVADLGTGTGCIAVTVAYHLPQAVVYATDANAGALSLAFGNATRHEVRQRIEFVEGEVGQWAEPLLREGQRGLFDAILTNPPYISRADVEQLPVPIRDHEPHSALEAGEDGLDCYREIAAQCGELLAPDGFLLAELGAGQYSAVRAIFEAHSWKVEPPLLDYAGHERVLCATRA